MAGPFFVIRVNYNIKCNTCGQKKAHTEILWYNKNC